ARLRPPLRPAQHGQRSLYLLPLPILALESPHPRDCLVGRLGYRKASLCPLSIPLPIPRNFFMLKRLFTAALLAALLPLSLAGCDSNAAGQPKTTFLTTDDLIRMTDKMAQEIVANDYLKLQPGPLKIVIKPVINE